MIDRDWIAARIPHHGTMCLLDHVEDWDEQNIVCRSSSHLSLQNPLRAHASLGIANAIEYAAQAMAVHCALLTGESSAPQSGYLASVRDVHWQCSRFDDLMSDLRISAQRISGNGNTVLYSFAIDCDEQPLLQGRASIVLNAAAVQSTRA